MPKAEVGSAKHLANKMKSKGLQRLRWYCQACERQMRDENGFKCHVQSEAHYRTMVTLGQHAGRAISNYSSQFMGDFLSLLRTSHNTKPVHINHFYNLYISHKEHIHMNATRWKSLTEFARFLGRSGICRVEENEKGVHIAWIDNSADNLRRQEALKKRERMDKGDEEREQKLIEEQIRRAQETAPTIETVDEEARTLQRGEGEKIQLNFKPASKLPTPPKSDEENEKADSDTPGEQAQKDPQQSKEEPPKTESGAPIKVSFGAAGGKPKNVFAAKKNPLAAKRTLVAEPPKKMSEAERIMKAELERKQGGVAFGLGAKRQRVS